jgi:hypothetical protein
MTCVGHHVRQVAGRVCRAKDHHPEGLRSKTNCPAHVFESKGLNSILVKRTVRPKLMIHRDLILKRRKGFIRCQQQIDVPGAPGLLTDPKACNRSIFNGLDPFLGSKSQDSRGANLNHINAMFSVVCFRRGAASWNKGKPPINELDPGHGLGKSSGRTAGTLNSAWPWAGAGEKTPRDYERSRNVTVNRGLARNIVDVRSMN